MLRRITVQIFALATGAASLVGCSSIQAPALPTGAQLAAYYSDEFDLPNGVGADGNDLHDALLVGIRYVDDQCTQFFDSLIEIDRRLEFEKSALLTAGTQVQTLMGLAKESALNIARVAAAAEITKVLIEQFQDKFTFRPHTVELRAIIMEAMKNQKEQLYLAIPRTRVEVVVAVKTYAENCTLGNIREQWDRSIAKAVREGVSPVGREPVGHGEGFLGDVPETRRSPRSVLTVDRYVVQ
jgi:hypothetical protein